MSNEIPCDCEICQLARRLHGVVEKMSSEERDVVEVLWSRMEHAETRLEMLETLAKEGEDIGLGGRLYRAVDKTSV